MLDVRLFLIITLCHYYQFAVSDEQQAHEAHQALCEELQSWGLVCSLSNEQVGSSYCFKKSGFDQFINYL